MWIQFFRGVAPTAYIETTAMPRQPPITLLFTLDFRLAGTFIGMVGNCSDTTISREWKVLTLNLSNFRIALLLGTPEIAFSTVLCKIYILSLSLDVHLS